MGYLKMADFCRLLVLVASLYLIVDARSAKKVDAENDPEKKILINLLERILEIKRQKIKDKELEADVSPMTSRDKNVEKGSDKLLAIDVKDKNKNKDNTKDKENNSTLKEFDNCTEAAGSEDQELMNSFKIEKNGKSHGTGCSKKRKQIKDGLQLSPSQKDSLKRNFEKTEFFLWPKGILQYVISSDFTKEEKKVIRTAFDEIESKTCIKLEPYNGVPVDPNLKTYLNIISADGCWSYMGRIEEKGYQPQNLSLEKGECIENDIVIHEILHALGMAHEQSRKDRDKYLTMNFASIFRGKENINFKKFDTDDKNEFDYESVLQYDLLAGSMDGKKVMEPKLKDLSFLPGSAKNLEFYDVKDITDAYKCTAHCKTKPACQYAGFINFKCECYCPFGIKGDKCTELETDKGCGGFIDVSKGPKTIESPNYPKHYSLDTQCIWLVETKKGHRIRLNVDDMHLSSSAKNCHHWLQVRYNLLGQTGIRICGNGKDQDVFQTTPAGNSNMMMLIFNSKKLDKATTDKGFKLTVSSFQPENPCERNPCENGGKCSALESDFNCSCIQGWVGKTCKVNPCYPNPCKNGGECEGSGFQFSCVCDAGWGGNTCEVKTDPCNPNPCRNGGQCSKSKPPFTCSCRTGWSGLLCENKGPCHSQPCLNNGTCTDVNGFLKCLCSGWYGTTCNLKGHCDFNSKDEKCFMHDSWTKGEANNKRFKHVLTSDIRRNGYIFVNSTATGYESANFISKPEFSAGEYCFRYSYYQYAGSGAEDHAATYITYGENVVLDITGNKGDKWMDKKASLKLKSEDTIQIGATVYENAVIAFDDISLVRGGC